MPDPSFGLERGLAGLTIGVVKATRAKERRHNSSGMDETEQQFQVAISGTADTGIGFSNVDIVFDYHMFYAPGQRDSDLEKPHFTYGAEIYPDSSDGPVAISACVMGWVLDPHTGGVRGATVAIGAHAPLTTNYSGVAHLTFQGFASPAEDVPSVR